MDNHTWLLLKPLLAVTSDPDEVFVDSHEELITKCVWVEFFSVCGWSFSQHLLHQRRLQGSRGVLPPTWYIPPRRATLSTTRFWFSTENKVSKGLFLCKYSLINFIDTVNVFVYSLKSIKLMKNNKVHAYKNFHRFVGFSAVVRQLFQILSLTDGFPLPYSSTSHPGATSVTKQGV